MEDFYASIILGAVVNTPIQLTLILLKIFTKVTVPWPGIFQGSFFRQSALQLLSYLCSALISLSCWQISLMTGGMTAKSR